MPQGVAERHGIEKHRYRAAGLLRQRKRVLYEAIGKAAAVGRIGDDVFCPHAALLEKVNVSIPIAAVNEVTCDDSVPRFNECIGERAVAARRFPHLSLE